MKRGKRMIISGWEMPNISGSLAIKSEESVKSSQEDLIAFNELSSIIENKSIRSVFQPIISLFDGATLGYEALSRGPQGSILEQPGKLFAAAEKFNKVWELEFLCRTRALEKATSILPQLPDRMLFINVDPKVINDVRFQKGVTKEMLAQYGIDTTNIIFEITEKTSVEDYRSFRCVLDNYTSQGYKIAIDDTGSGYSGLRLLAETRPQFVKIDMALVRDIDKDTIKQALIRSFQEFATVTNMKIIAEGIETADELITLIKIGIPYGQGYFLQKPSPQFLEAGQQVKKIIIQQNDQKKREFFHTPVTIPIGEIVRLDSTFPPATAGCQAVDYFNANPNIMGVTIVHDGKPVGLLMKDKFFTNLATQYGTAVYLNRPVSLLMDRNPLIVDYNTPLEQVTKSAISRDEARLYDYIVVTQQNKYYGVTTIKCLLEKTTQLEVNRAKHTNPLSGLPGNILIEEKLRQVVEATDRDFAVLYFDLDNFKAYNDVYGFENGDKILCLTGQLIQQQLAGMAAEGFLGHIGGDDFIAVLKGADVVKVCQDIIDSFDIRIKDFYTEEDQQRGYIISKNRHGTHEQFPIISLSIGVVTNKSRNFYSVAELGKAAGTVKKQCKMNWKSCYCVLG